MSSEKWAQKFHTDDVSLHRSGQDSDSAWGKQIFHIARPIRSSSSLENKESSVPWRMEWLTFFNSCTCIRVTRIILFCPQWRSLQATVYLGCVFLLGKSKSAFPNPKRDCALFFVQLQKIHVLGGLFGSYPNPEFRDSQSERFFGKGFEKSIFDNRFSEQKWMKF